MLEREEFRKFVDDARLYMYLPQCDDDIFNRALQVLDKKKTGNIELEDLLCGIEYTYAIIAEVGKELEEVLRTDFEDMDFDNTNSLVLDGLLPYFHRIGRREGIKKCQHWQVEYILSLIDDNDNGALDVDELLANYRVIIKELVNFNSWEDPERRPLFWKNTRKNRLRKSVFARMETHLKYKPGRRGADDGPESLSKIEDVNPLIKIHSQYKLPVTSLVNLSDQERIFDLKKIECAKESEQKQELKISQFQRGVRSLIIQGIENLPGPNSGSISPVKRSPKKNTPLVKKSSTINLDLLQGDLESPTRAGALRRGSPTKVSRDGNSQFEGFKRTKAKGALGILARSLVKDKGNREDIIEVSSDSSIETNEATEVFKFGQKFGKGPTPDVPAGNNKVVSIVQDIDGQVTYRKFPLNKFAFNRQSQIEPVLDQEQIDQMADELMDTYPSAPEDTHNDPSLEKASIASPLYENFRSGRRQVTRDYCTSPSPEDFGLTVHKRDSDTPNNPSKFGLPCLPGALGGFPKKSLGGSTFYGANSEANSHNISPVKQGFISRKGSIKEVKIFSSEGGLTNNMTKGSFNPPSLSEHIRHMHADAKGKISGSPTKNINSIHNHSMHS